MKALKIQSWAPKEEMTSLDERIAALFRKGSPIYGDADPPPPADHPIAEEAASEVVASGPAGEETNATRVDDRTHVGLSGDDGSANTLTIGGIGFGFSDPPPLGAARYQSQANEINARQSK
jgi:hypothetical protein